MYLVRYITIPDHAGKIINEVFDEKFEEEMSDAYEEVKGKMKNIHVKGSRTEIL